MRLAVMLLCWAAVSPVHAIGLRTKFGSVVVKNLKIGQSYSLQQLVNLPLNILYNGGPGDPKVDIAVGVLDISTQDTQPGILPIPTTSWVEITNPIFKEVGPGKDVETDVILHIPDDPSLLGKRYEAHIWSHTISTKMNIALGLNSRVTMEIASLPPTKEEKGAKVPQKPLSNFDFDIFPLEGQADQFPLGKDVDLKKKYRASIKIANPNDQALKFKIRPIGSWETEIGAPPGFEPLPDPKFVTPAQSEVKVDGNAIKEVGLSMKIPDETQYRGKLFYATVAVDLLDQQVATHVYYKLLIKTESEVKK